MSATPAGPQSLRPGRSYLYQPRWRRTRTVRRRRPLGFVDPATAIDEQHGRDHDDHEDDEPGRDVAQFVVGGFARRLRFGHRDVDTVRRERSLAPRAAPASPGRTRRSCAGRCSARRGRAQASGWDERTARALRAWPAGLERRQALALEVDHGRGAPAEAANSSNAATASRAVVTRERCSGGSAHRRTLYTRP